LTVKDVNKTNGHRNISMQNFIRSTLAAAVLLTSTGMAFAQERRDERRDERRQEERRGDERHYEERRGPARRYESVEEHGGWRRGQEMRHDDWDRGRRFDYREYDLRAPPYGYEWREVGGAFVLGAIATGIIADILLNAR
jgi:Ni/Co efflux regulator RcnB